MYNCLLHVGQTEIANILPSLSSSFTTSHPYIFYQTMDLVLSLYTVVYVVHLVVTLAN